MTKAIMFTIYDSRTNTTLFKSNRDYNGLMYQYPYVYGQLNTAMYNHVELISTSLTSNIATVLINGNKAFIDDLWLIITCE